MVATANSSTNPDRFGVWPSSVEFRAHPGSGITLGRALVTLCSNRAQIWLNHWSQALTRLPADWKILIFKIIWGGAER